MPAVKSTAASRKPKVKKLFVLDTNVLMHDPTSLFRFDEHDSTCRSPRWRSSTQHKNGLSDVSRNARQASRFLDEIVTGDDIKQRPRAQDAATASRRRGACSCRPRRSTASCRATLAARQDRQPDPRGGALPAGEASRSAKWCWCRKTSTCASRRARSASPAEDYFNDKVLEDTDLLYTGVRPLPRGLLERARQGHGVVEEGRPHLLPRARPAGAEAARQRVRLRRDRRAAALRAGQGGAGPRRGARDAARLHPRQELGVGHHRAQPRAELRAQPADEPGDRLRHAARPGRHRQDAARARRRPDAGARRQALLRDHHDARHGADRRGHRLPARHRGGEDDAVDGRARGQPRRAQRHRRRRAASGAAPRRATWSARASR